MMVTKMNKIQFLNRKGKWQKSYITTPLKDDKNMKPISFGDFYLCSENDMVYREVN